MERILLILSALFFTLNLWARPPLSDQEIAEIVQEFQYQDNYKEISSSKKGGAFADCWEYNIKAETLSPSMNQPLVVDIRMYMPNRRDLGDKTVPVVVMVPPIGGLNFLDKQMGKTFCDYDVAAVILKNDFANLETQANGKLLPPEDHQKTFHRIGSAIKSIKAMAFNDKNIDGTQFGVFGVSLGGILSSFIMATQPDISAGYFVVAGGDIPNILAYSDQEEVSIIRRKRMKQENIQTKEDYEVFLRQYITYDPMDMAINMLPETINMVVATEDLTVPSSNQEALYLAFGEPDTRFVNASHVKAVINSLLLGSKRSKVAKFFLNRFKQTNPRPAIFEWMEQFNLYY